MKPYSQACERNKEPILAVLRSVFAEVSSVLELGSGTGQHAVYFGAVLTHLSWRCSDLPANHGGIRLWLDEAKLANVEPPLTLDVDDPEWRVPAVDAAFTANTLHIVSWPQVERMFAGVGRLLSPGDPFCVYGPFCRDGRHTSESNARFDAMLRARDPNSGIRDMADLVSLGGRCGLTLEQDVPMPANNRTLVWRADG